MNPLYGIPDDPARARAYLLRHYGHHGSSARISAAVLDDVRLLLTDEGLGPRETRNLASAAAGLSDGHFALGGKTEGERLARELAAALRGPLGLARFLILASDAARLTSHWHASIDEARSLILDQAVRESLRAFYSVPAKYDFAACQLHRVGTTSVILACHLRTPVAGRPSRIALKCLLPRYLSVQAIKDKTREYKTDHQLKDTNVVPWIYDSTESWIGLEYIEGKTLAERLTRELPPIRGAYQSDEAFTVAREEYATYRILQRGDIEDIRAYGLAILRALSELAALGRLHGDLSPSNIIVTSPPNSDTVTVRFIDLGESYAIAERVGSSAAVSRASLYVAPELMEDHASADWQCDLYSLGIILLEAAAKRALSHEDIHEELDRLWRGEKKWDGAPGYARIVEDLIDEQSDCRLLLAPDKSQAGAYDYLERLLLQESQVLELYDQNTESFGSGFGVLRGSNVIKFWKNEQIKNLFQARDHIKEPVDDEYAAFPRLAKWAATSVALWTFTLAAFVFLTLADTRFQLCYGWIKQLEAPTPVHVGSLRHNLPGRLVALTFALTAVTYYVNNFGTLAPGRLGGGLMRTSHFVMRATAVGLYFPILFTMLYNPQAWPLCSGLGTLLVVLNNYLALLVAERGEKVGAANFTTLGTGGRRFIDDIFGEWWLLMGGYSVSMTAIGILLLVGIAHDAAIFAILVVVINVIQMYRLNCVTFAPQVRGWLAREILVLRRGARIRPSPEAVVAATPPMGS